MIIYHADDYGINVNQSKRIMKCKNSGCLNSVSIIPTSSYLNETMKLLDDDCKKGIHLNICEGKALSNPTDIPLLVDENGRFKNSFLKALLLSVFVRDNFEEQVAHECSLQLEHVLRYMPEGYKLRVDSHRHYHMIPGVLRAICKTIDKMGLEVEYLRLPMEDFRLYIKDPRLWCRISPLSLIKAIVLNTCGMINKPFLKKQGLIDKTCKYIGVLFTDRMFFENIEPLVRRVKHEKKYEKLDVEIQFHPGGILQGEPMLDEQFKDWYSSANRLREAEALMALERN